MKYGGAVLLRRRQMTPPPFQADIVC